jgi:tRNA modification GTPase
MFSTDDTIVAIATPPGRGGIGVVRLSGPAAHDIACRLSDRGPFEPRHATLATVSAPGGAPIDRAVVTYIPAPHSYTGDAVVEVSAHGSPVVLRAIVTAAMECGARLARPGEFTFRAYLNRRIDLVQAEAVGDLIDAITPLQARVAFDQLDGTLTSRLREMDAALLELIAPLEASLDFPDEGYHFVAENETATAIRRTLANLDVLLADARRGRVIREGLTAAIVGRPNAGKSSLFNRLAGAARAIVTDVPGTTRDLLTERVDVGGVPFTVVDTAGLRGAAGDAIEAEGISRARQAVAAADLVLVVLDRSRALEEEDRELLRETSTRARVVVASKADLPAAWTPEAGTIEVSALTDEGVASLREALCAAAGIGDLREHAPVANQRHVALLEKAREALARAATAAAEKTPEEFVLADLHEARARFDEVTGLRPQDEVLALIFERFCIGK